MEVFLFDSLNSVDKDRKENRYDEKDIKSHESANTMGAVIKNMCFKGDTPSTCCSYETYKDLRVPNQENGHDCGVHVVNNLKQLMDIHDKYIAKSEVYDDWDGLNEFVINYAFTGNARQMSRIRKGFTTLYQKLYEERMLSVKDWISDIDNKKW